MRHGVEHRLLVEFVRRRVDQDGRVHKVAHPVRAAAHVQHHVPVRPTVGPVLQVANDVQRVVHSTLPIAHLDVLFLEVEARASLKMNLIAIKEKMRCHLARQNQSVRLKVMHFGQIGVVRLNVPMKGQPIDGGCRLAAVVNLL